MDFKQVSLAHTTTIGTFVIVSLPNISREDFIKNLKDAINKATPTNPQRDTNVITQNLMVDETQVDIHTCLWSIHFNGTHAPETVRTKCQSIYDGIRTKVESVGSRVTFRLETLHGSWAVD